MFRFCLLALFISIFSFDANAQSLDSSTLRQENTTKKDDNPWLSNPRKTNRTQPITSIKNNKSTYTEVNKENVEGLYLKEVGPKKLEDPSSQKKKPKRYIPQQQRPTLDGVQRGDVSLQPLNDDPDVDDRLIFVSYKDFNIRVSMSGTVMCDIRFIVLSTLDRKINNVSFKLNWPEISTSLSYNNVAPNVDTYFDYTLIGNGCYSMDKTPNIVVNRCRVAGMTQQDCAKKINWLLK